MNLEEKIFDDYKTAFKARETHRKEILNFVISLIKNKKIELQKDPSDEEIIQILKKEIKAREESIFYLQKAENKDEEIETEKEYIKILQQYLPAMMNEQELTNLVKKLIEENNFDIWKNRWQIIQAIMKDHRPVVDWKMLNEIINKL